MSLQELRGEIDSINREFVLLLAKRLSLSRKVAAIKKEQRLPVLDEARERLILEEMAALARQHNISSLIVQEIFQIILETSRLEMELVIR